MIRLTNGKAVSKTIALVLAFGFVSLTALWKSSTFARGRCDTRVTEQCVQCSRFTGENDSAYIKYWSGQKDQLQKHLPSCEHLTDNFIQPAELSPIGVAYSILAHKDWQHVYELLRTIYEPANHYCIHVDAKSTGLRHMVGQLTRCLPNVVVTNRTETVYWAGYPILRAHLNCLEELSTTDRRWKYWINLSAQDFPLKSNAELSSVLTAWQGASNMETVVDDHPLRYERVHRLMLNRFGNPDHHVITDQIKPPAPANLTIYKSNVAVVLHRDFTDWLLFDNPVAEQLLDWLKDTDMPDEHFWATMALNTHVQAGRKFDLVRPYVARLAVWKRATSRCAGKYLRDVCVFGVGDLARLQSHTDHLFANKLYLGYQSAAYRCMQHWILRKS